MPDPEPHDTPGPARPKRAQVAAACTKCRAKKIKCDAGMPCSSCERRHLTCAYETEAGETHRAASKRKFNDLTQAHDTYAEVFELLRDPNPRKAADVLHYIKQGYSASAALELIKKRYRCVDAGSGSYNSPDQAQQALLIILAHSTGSSGEIVALASHTLDPKFRTRLPSPQSFYYFHNRMVHFSHVRSILTGRATFLPDPTNTVGFSEESTIGDALHFDDTREVKRTGDDPPHLVTAAPWVSLTENDAAISHLVSLFLAWINPTWRFVEEDLFLRGMRSKTLGSEFCSPFLVNSICAIACLHSEHEVAFVGTGYDRIARGKHFHDEAVRLWALEESLPTLTNIQALCVLSLESNYRAKDRLGLTLVPIAVQLDNQLSLEGDEDRCRAQGISKRDFTRARLATHWTARCTQIIMRIAFMSPDNIPSRVSRLPEIQDVFTDSFEHWIGYPMTGNIVFHRPTLYLQARCRLAELFQDMHDVVLADKWRHSVGLRDYASAIDRVAGEIELWYQRLPRELQYRWPVTVNVWELHASYLSSLMILFTAAKAHLEQGDQRRSPESPHTDPHFGSQRARDYLSSAIPLAHRAAQLLREFRENYGLKITPAWLLQLQGVTAGVLLQDPEVAEPALIPTPAVDGVIRPINDSHTAFDEVFRSLLGTGVEVMIARGIARMMYHTALERRIPLPQTTRSLLQVLSSTAWRPSDLSLVNSVFPNYASADVYGDSARMTVLLSKWEI